MEDLQRLLYKDQIRDLAIRYALATDRRDIESLVTLFVDDVQVGRDAAGHAALRDSFHQQLRNVGITILFVGNHAIDFEDDARARGVVYCRAEIQDGERWIRQAIRYDDTYERRGEAWLFVRRRHLLFYGAEIGENPLSLGPANWPLNHTGRGTLPESDSSWQEFWHGGN